MPEMIRYYLGEEPILAATCRPTSASDEDDRRYMLEHLDELVVKTVDGSGGYGMLIGPVASAEERERFRRQIEADPREFIAQPTIALSRMPIYLDELAARARRPPARSCSPSRITSVVPGGLTRAALRDGLAGRQLLAGRRQQGHLGRCACLMLSRVAESLYWTGRYIERAEDTSRLLHVNFHGLLDARRARPRSAAGATCLLRSGRDELFREHFSDYSAQAVTEFMLWHPANPDAVTACVARARENARGVREQISSEMWEHLNRLHLLVSRTRPAARARLAARVPRAHPRGRRTPSRA